MGKDDTSEGHLERAGFSAGPHHPGREGIREYFPAHVQSLIQELKARRVELEMQREELGRVRGERDAAREKFTGLIGTTLADMRDFGRAGALLKRGKKEIRDVANESREIIFLLGPSGEITFCSPALENVLGYSRNDAIGGKISKYLPGRQSTPFEEHFRRVNCGETVEMFEVNLLRKDGKQIPFEIDLSPVLEHGEVRTILAIARNLEMSRESENRKRLVHRLLMIANGHSGMKGLLEGFLEEIRRLTGCDAIGIRLREKDGRIPYRTCKGFSEAFYNLENPLSLKSDRCMCINVIEGAYDPALPFFTKNGSFWINGTTRFPATVPEQGKGRVRNRCNREGYESVALIPIRAGNEIMGLIHLADREKNKFPLTLVEGLEWAALYLGAALKRVLAEEALLDANSELQRRVEERTRGLLRFNARLRQEIMERKSAEKRLLAAKRKFSKMVERSLSGISLIQNGKIVFVNKRFAGIYGYSKKELIGLDPMKLLHPESRPLVREIIKRKLRGEKTLPVYEVKGLKKNGDTIWVSGKIDVSEYEGKKAIMGHVFDISVSKRACEGLMASKKKLRSLSNRVLGAYEEERKRIARELHDVLGQNLSAIKFSVENALRLGDRAGLEHGFKLLENVVPLVQESMKEVRRISKNLRPDVLDDLGILSTIHWFGLEFEKIYPKIRIHNHLEIHEKRVPDPLKIVIFRILQEALHNVAKHSGAGLAKVFLKEIDGQIQLVVEDNGSGFDVEGVLNDGNPERGLGLMSMKERLELSGGVFAVESHKDCGTTVRASWALDRRLSE